MDRGLLHREAEAHFKEHGDVVQFKQDGNPNASYEVIRGDVTRYAYGLTKDWQDAEDAVQEAYCRILERGKEEDLNFGGLFKIILDHTMTDKFRKDAVRSHIQHEDLYVEGEDEEGPRSVVALAESDEPDPLLMLEFQQKIDFIMDSSNKMNPKSKGIIRMAYIFGYTHTEIANILNVNRRKVDNLIARFKKKFEEWDE